MSKQSHSNPELDNVLEAGLPAHICPQCKSFGDIEPISAVQEICDHCKRSNDLDRQHEDRLTARERADYYGTNEADEDAADQEAADNESAALARATGEAAV